jgi:YggT family protein
MSGALDDIIGMIFQVACWFVLARFILQASRADFYNPISQGVVKATDPLLKPMRMVIPAFKNIDAAALVLAWLLELVAYVLIDLIKWSAVVHSWAFLALASFVGVISVLINMYLFFILILVVQSWIAPGNYNPVSVLLQQVTEPILAPARKILPPFGGLDLSPMVVWLVLIVVERLVRGLVLTLQV